MKRFIFITIFAFSCFNAYAISDKGNGGNECSKKFSRYGRVIYDVIKENDFYKNRVNLEFLDEAINSAFVVVSNDPLYDRNGGAVPATNDGNSMITLSKEDWCESLGLVDPEIVLHEYLGISEPDLDLQYQVSGVLSFQTGLSIRDFYNFYRSGSDFEIQTLRGFESLFDLNDEEVVIESRPISSYNNYIHLSDSVRYGHRARISCKKGNGKLELFSLYALKGPKDGWFYKKTLLGDFAFRSSIQCERFLNTAKLAGTKEVRIELGMDSSTVLDVWAL